RRAYIFLFITMFIPASYIFSVAHSIEEYTVAAFSFSIGFFVLYVIKNRDSKLAYLIQKYL
ncbi:MAG: hypothetical protein WBG69_07030, partial [Arcobacteraceae bacterium]